MWLGNDKIHALTTKDTELLIQLQGDDGSTGYAIYTDFRVSDEKDQYRLLLGTTAGFSGNIANSFFEHNNATFTTADLTIGGNCAIAEGGGWWFTNCGDALLNSVMIKWSGFGTGVAITMTEMKIRRKDGEDLILLANQLDFLSQSNLQMALVRVRRCVLEKTGSREYKKGPRECLPPSVYLSLAQP